MHTDLKSAILTALAGSSSQQPVDTITLYSLGAQKRVKTALMELYQAQEVCCCKITTRGVERLVWWISGGDLALPRYGNTGRSAAA